MVKTTITSSRREKAGTTDTENAGQPASSFVRIAMPRASGTDNARLLKLAETVGNMGHWYADLVTGDMTWSPQIFRIFGVDAKSFAPSVRAVIAAAHPDDRSHIEAKLDEATRSKTNFEFDYRILRPDGNRRTVISTGQPELDASGRVVALFGVITDVTEAFDTVHAIQDQNEMLDLAAELAQLGHWVWSQEEDRLSFCSNELARIHEMAPGTFLRQFTHPSLLSAVGIVDDREQYRATVTDARQRAAAYQIEYRIKTRGGLTKDLHEIGQPIFDRDGRLSRFIASAQDITSTKQRESELLAARRDFEAQTEALRRSKAKLRDIIENSIQGIVVFHGFRPVFANATYARIMGLDTPESVIALDDIRNHLDAAGSDQKAAFWDEILCEGASGTARQRQCNTVTADGRHIWIECIGTRITWDSAPAVLVTVIDVTERCHAEEELKRKTYELQQLNLQKDKLFSIIAHDLRSPFNSIIGFSDLLVSSARDLSHGQTVSYAQIVREAATGVHNLLDNLLAWASFQIRDGALKLAPLDMAAVVSGSIEPLTYMAETKGVTIAHNISNVSALGDEPLIRIVIRNLVSNGIKFSRNGGVVQITAEPIPDFETPQIPMVRISVHDDGVGMSGAAVATLFELDSTVSVPGTRGEKGTGLGLYLCRDIIGRHGGSVFVDSAPGAGTSFHFTLPAAL